jgi:hypothetical protein
MTEMTQSGSRQWIAIVSVAPAAADQRKMLNASSKRILLSRALLRKHDELKLSHSIEEQR